MSGTQDLSDASIGGEARGTGNAIDPVMATSRPRDRSVAPGPVLGVGGVLARLLGFARIISTYSTTGRDHVAWAIRGN